MQTTIKIHEVLNYSKEEFDNLQMERYMRWCISQAIDLNKDLQKIIANSSINRYYNIEMAKLEKKFIDIVDGKQIHIDEKTAREMYALIVVDLHRMYPSPLIHNARKLNVYAN